MSDGELVYIPCPLCGCEDLTLFSEDSGMTFRRCTKCGLVFLNPRPPSVRPDDDSDTAAMETAEEIDGCRQQRGDPGHLEDWTAPRARGFIMGSRLISRYACGGRLLDIGCGDGRFLLAMQEIGGFELYGLDPDPAAASRASRVLGIDIFQGTLDEAGYEEDFFDIVTMWDVLEHLENPLIGLQEVRRVLKPAGLLIARIPNLAYFRLKETLAGPFLGPRGISIYGPRHHLTYFTRDTAGLLFKEAGFEILSMIPSRSEYGFGGVGIAVKSCYHAAAMAAYQLSARRLCLTVDLLILATTPPGLKQKGFVRIRHGGFRKRFSA